MNVKSTHVNFETVKMMLFLDLFFKNISLYHGGTRSKSQLKAS